MNRFFPVLLLLLGGQVGFSQNSPELPLAAKQLVERLERWEASQRKDLEKQFSLKSAETARELNRHLESATRSGDLDGAIAIRNKIAELQGPILPTSPAELSNWLQGRKIEFQGASGRHVIEFKRDSTVLYHEKKSGQLISYRALSDRSIEFRWDAAYKLEFSADMTEATFVTPAGKYPVKTDANG